MKIAILFSGLIFDGAPYEENINSVRAAFPNADCYYGTWDTPQNNDKKFFNVKFPIMKHHYNCNSAGIKYSISQIRKAKEQNLEPSEIDISIIKRRNISRYNLNQFLIHTMMFEKYAQNNDYDIIIRARYETFIDPNNIDKFNYFIEKCYNDMKPIGFETIDIQYKEMPCGWNEYCQSMPNTTSFSDWLIIHRKDKFFPDKIWEMYRNKEIRNAELGWYDIIFKASNFEDMTNCCWNGYVDLRRDYNHPWKI